MKFALKHLKLAMAGVAMMSTQVLADTHFLIPGGPGGGWDTTARAVGEALVKSGLESNASFQNMSGGGGGRAIAYLIESGNKKGDMLMVNSTPIVLRALSGKIPYSYRDLTPVASVIADYGAFVVRDDSPFKSWKEVIARLEVSPGSVTVAGGSARGSMDHLVAAQAVKAAGVDGRKLRYIPYDAGGKAKAGLLSGEVKMLSTGLSEALDMAKSGQARILAVTAPEPIADYPEIPTLKSLGYDMEFVNWRGFFAAPDLPQAKLDEYTVRLQKLVQSKEWEAVRARNGWLNLFKPQHEFIEALEAQEAQLKVVMEELGFVRR
ncbi:tripartite tricarboxylate transporter substrate binding protein [Pseudoalteromonas piscicida]|uniref:Tripartite tricarboxylate transporter substrate binding protein n=1 Tax=Pseudoalteromonas piscicida TaxID=43662 RepID=A0AAQ2EW67_PSEO7|nr:MULTISPECIES: tripartite tricarboxylate transporter substrate-binding protein [Pseudoalteromonas]KJY86960.1 transporter [Pseudoalteromonas piscicida]TMN38536.1 tripartite tricarboxylate transporter substrate binding protein [Pseudoalteromonas piscicida]TMN45043.1 tripartite tricarboxylate transporter substrate binding protein [Pseudoalteromonas piscicida]TMN50021.1 tripartite tricarboxylate transporter substrate binding protein [Pseudoalteromonas piscicida]TMN51969.1 tripartite tricarboxyla